MIKLKIEGDGGEIVALIHALQGARAGLRHGRPRCWKLRAQSRIPHSPT